MIRTSFVLHPTDRVFEARCSSDKHSIAIKEVPMGQLQLGIPEHCSSFSYEIEYSPPLPLGIFLSRSFTLEKRKYVYLGDPNFKHFRNRSEYPLRFSTYNWSCAPRVQSVADALLVLGNLGRRGGQNPKHNNFIR